MAEGLNALFSGVKLAKRDAGKTEVESPAARAAFAAKWHDR
jgi:hypothetical protein